MIAVITTILGGLAGSALAMSRFRHGSEDLSDEAVARQPEAAAAQKAQVAAYDAAVADGGVTRPEESASEPSSSPTRGSRQ